MDVKTNASAGSGSRDVREVIEHNDDLIAAIVENLQLGRLDSCMKYYAILQRNLVKLGSDVDASIIQLKKGDSTTGLGLLPPDTDIANESKDPYTALSHFGDFIYRRDVLDDLANSGQKSGKTPVAPIPLACDECHAEGLDEFSCRISRAHTKPPHFLSSQEKQDLYGVACLAVLREVDADVASSVFHASRSKNHRMSRSSRSSSVSGATRLQQNQQQQQAAGRGQNIQPGYDVQIHGGQLPQNHSFNVDNNMGNYNVYYSDQNINMKMQPYIPNSNSNLMNQQSFNTGTYIPAPPLRSLASFPSGNAVPQPAPILRNALASSDMPHQPAPFRGTIGRGTILSSSAASSGGKRRDNSAPESFPVYDISEASKKASRGNNSSKAKGSNTGNNHISNNSIGRDSLNRGINGTVSFNLNEGRTEGDGMIIVSDQMNSSGQSKKRGTASSAAKQPKQPKPPKPPKEPKPAKAAKVAKAPRVTKAATKEKDASKKRVDKKARSDDSDIDGDRSSHQFAGGGVGSNTIGSILESPNISLSGYDNGSMLLGEDSLMFHGLINENSFMG